MLWKQWFSDFEFYLRLEKSLSENTIEAYVRDIRKLHDYLECHEIIKSPTDVKLSDITDFLYWISVLGIGARSQARIVSGIKAFYSYLLLEDKIKDDPTLLLEGQKTGLKLPEVLTVEEIDSIIASFDLSKNEGQRNRAIIETLYSCGLRVSELINLRITNMHFDEGYVRVVGKGDKERLVPISKKCIKEITLYNTGYRRHQEIKPNSKDILFLNRRGGKLTRVMIFTIVKNAARDAGIKRAISPHTFRHSFATHLVDGGADLRSVQEMLGHESITSTEIYTHLDRQHLRETIALYHPRANNL